MVSEKVGGAEGTKLDDDFRDLERVREQSSFIVKRANKSKLCTHSTLLLIAEELVPSYKYHWFAGILGLCTPGETRQVKDVIMCTHWDVYLSLS